MDESWTILRPRLSALQAIYKEAEYELGEIERFVNKCEVGLSECLRHSTLPPKELVEAIATAKVNHRIPAFSPIAISALIMQAHLHHASAILKIDAKCRRVSCCFPDGEM